MFFYQSTWLKWLIWSIYLVKLTTLVKMAMGFSQMGHLMPITYLLLTYQPTHLPWCNTYLSTHPPTYLHIYYLPTYLDVLPTYLWHYYNSWSFRMGFRIEKIPKSDKCQENHSINLDNLFVHVSRDWTFKLDLAISTKGMTNYLISG
jgi:hypothetical protein